MEKELESVLLKYNYKYAKIFGQNSLQKIYNLFVHHKKDIPINSIEFLYYGVYYEIIDKNDNLMIKYYLEAIKCNNYYASHNLASYYQREKNYELFKKYIEIPVKSRYPLSCRLMGDYYQLVDKDYKKMEEMYLIGIENGDSASANNLGCYYYNTIKKDLAIECLELAVTFNDIYKDAYKNLGLCYGYIKKDYIKMEEYLLYGYKMGSKKSFKELCNYYTNNQKNQIYDHFFFEFINLCKLDKLPENFKIIKELYCHKFNLMKLHFEYSYNDGNSIGYREALNDFKNMSLVYQK